MDIRELRLGNLVSVNEKLRDRGDLVQLSQEMFESLIVFKTYHRIFPIPLTPETLEKYIDWEFEFGFNKSFVEREHWNQEHYLLENIIDRSSDFKIVFSKSKQHLHLEEITYYVDDNLLEFGLDDTIHNLQNLFYIVSGQELPVKL